MLDIEKLYLKSPIILQNILLNIKSNLIYRRRYGNNFKLFLNNYLKSDKQLDKILLREFLSSASHTKFWAKKFKKHNFNINAKDIQQEIKKLPILNKKEVKQNIDEIINIENSKSYSWANTSGTTGSGLVFPQTRVMEQKQWAIWWRHRITHGIKFGTWMGWFGGRSIASLKQKKPPFHRLNYPMKQIMFSAYHLNIDTVIIYYDLIKKFKLKWLHGYPSQISNFASLVNQIGLPKIETLEIISFGAETLLESQKENIKKVFNVKLIEHYGLAEGVSNISENINGNFEIDQDFAYTELINNNNNERKIIGTNYSNIAFPLIRYDTGDVALVDENDNDKILSILGRVEDYIILPNGVKLGRLDHIFKDITEVNEAQIFQKYKNELEFRIVKNTNIDNNLLEKKILNYARKKISNDVKISFKYLNKIPRTKSGKLKFVISKIKN